MDILVCVKRVPATGATIVLTADEQAIETRNLGFAVSPHEECAVEEAIQQVEQHGGLAAVLTVGTEDAIEQLREAIAMGVERAVLVETDGSDWDPMATAQAVAEAIRKQAEAGQTFDMIFFGNESADSGGYQVGIRVAKALDLPCVTGIKSLELKNGQAIAKREVSGGWEVYEVALPAVFTLKEGINLPRYPSLPGRLRAKKKAIERVTVEHHPGGLTKVRLQVPPEDEGGAEIIGEGPAAAAKIGNILQELGLVPS